MFLAFSRAALACPALARRLALRVERDRSRSLRCWRCRHATSRRTLAGAPRRGRSGGSLTDGR
eukprot:3237930-Prymnesium_polylepis.1